MCFLGWTNYAFFFWCSLISPVYLVSYMRALANSVSFNIERDPKNQTMTQLVAVQAILDRLRSEVETKRISVHPLLHDADRHFGFTKGVTPSQLSRVLDTLGLHVAMHEHVLLANKFVNPVTGHFNYPAFVAAIDPSVSMHAFRCLAFSIFSSAILWLLYTIYT